MTKLVSTIALLGMLTACGADISTPDATIQKDGYRIDIDGDNNHKGKHCPPGHRMKGWC